MEERLHHVIDLDLAPHEASGLVTSGSARLREALGWSPLYWTILDDGQVQDCIAVIGQETGSRDVTANWASRRLEATITTPTEATDDGEAIAEYDGWVYVFGSAYGSKDGPLEPARSFVARFHEDDVRVDDGGRLSADLHVQRDPFVLHRVVNDALRDVGVDLLALSPKYRKKMVRKARKKALKDDAGWAWRLQHDDSPINIEGAAFRSGGTLLLGLRMPVTRQGNPIMVEIEGVDRLFDPAVGDPAAVAVWVVGNVGSARELVGIRDLHVDERDELHLLLGNLDSDPDDSLLLQEHPEGGPALSAHWRTVLRSNAEAGVGRLEAEPVHTFDGLYRVEGLAVSADGQFMFVSDEDDAVRTRVFTTGPPGLDRSEPA